MLRGSGARGQLSEEAFRRLPGSFPLLTAHVRLESGRAMCSVVAAKLLPVAGSRDTGPPEVAPSDCREVALELRQKICEPLWVTREEPGRSPWVHPVS